MTRRKTQKLEDEVKKLEDLNQQLREKGYEIVLRHIPTKDVVAFDFGLIFTKDSKDVGLYVDDDLRLTLETLANQHGQILLKTNWFSPDVMVVTPNELAPTVPLGDTESDDTAEVVS